MRWIKNTKGKPDAMLTFSTISFIVVVFNIILSTFGSISVESFNLEFRPMDAGTMGVFLGATFTAYVSRRATDEASSAYVNGKKTELMSESEKEDEAL